MNTKTRDNIVVAGISVVFVFSGIYVILIRQSFKEFFAIVAGYIVVLGVITIVLTWGKQRLKLKNAPWDWRRFRIGKTDDYVSTLLSQMSQSQTIERRSWFGRKRVNNVHHLEKTVSGGKWQLSIETCNGKFVAYSVAFESSESTLLNFSVFESRHESYFLSAHE